MIVDLSHTEGRSVNDGISKEQSSLVYVSVDNIVQVTLRLGKGNSDGEDRYSQCLQGDFGVPGGPFVVGYAMGCLGIHRLCAPIWGEVSTQNF